MSAPRKRRITDADAINAAMRVREFIARLPDDSMTRTRAALVEIEDTYRIEDDDDE